MKREGSATVGKTASRTTKAAGVEVADGPVGLSGIEEILEEARNGRMFILVDDEDRENEGDLVLPAQMVTPDAINFMARYGRGLICLALTAKRCSELQLPPMLEKNEALLQTAFTVSIEAKRGVATGISAHDRAHTISVALNCRDATQSLVSPGHIFPLRARSGGVLARAGHTEAAVDVARLAGLNPSGVICEILKEDGTMARLPDLLAFAARHKLKIATIRDLIAYRCRWDHSVEKCGEVRLASRWGGLWQATGFANRITGATAVALVMGSISREKPVLVRMHALNVLADAFGAQGGRDPDLLQEAVAAIVQEGSGILVLLGQTSAHAVERMLQGYAVGSSTSLPVGEQPRDYGFGAQILAQLGVGKMELLSNSRHAPVALGGYGLEITGRRPLPSRKRRRALRRYI